MLQQAKNILVFSLDSFIKKTLVHIKNVKNPYLLHELTNWSLEFQDSFSPSTLSSWASFCLFFYYKFFLCLFQSIHLCVGVYLCLSVCPITLIPRLYIIFLFSLDSQLMWRWMNASWLAPFVREGGKKYIERIIGWDRDTLTNQHTPAEHIPHIPISPPSIKGRIQ